MSVSLVLLILRWLFVALLFLFLFSVLRAIYRDMRQAKARAGRGEEGPALARARLVHRGGTRPASGRSIPLGLAPVTIGRAEGNHLVIPNRFVSARHAQIAYRDGGHWLQDLGSTNGTILNGQRLLQPAPLSKGDAIEVGDTVLVYLK